MKRDTSPLFVSAFCLLVLLPSACVRSLVTPTQTPPAPSGPTLTPTPTPIPVTSAAVTASNYMFSPSAVTITHGNAVAFELGGGTHSLYIDDGAGTCAQNYSTWPQTIVFPTAGTFSFHCGYHSSPCYTTSCTGCTGMIGQVIVQ